jgi:hypothetical protein
MSGDFLHFPSRLGLPSALTNKVQDPHTSSLMISPPSGWMVPLRDTGENLVTHRDEHDQRMPQNAGLTFIPTQRRTGATLGDMQLRSDLLNAGTAMRGA